MSATADPGDGMSTGTLLTDMRGSGDMSHQTLHNLIFDMIASLAGSPSQEKCHEALEVLGTVLSEERFLMLCSESDEEKAFLALLDALASASDKKTAKLALWGLSRQQIPIALVVPHLKRVLGLVGPYLTPTREPSRHAVCALYAVHTVTGLAKNIPDGMRQHAEVWGPPLWRLTLAEPQGNDYWLEKRQWEMRLLREHAAEGLQEAMPLLMSNDGVLAAMAPLQGMLICDMTGDTSGTLVLDSPAQRSPSTSRATPPTSTKVSLARTPSTTLPCSTSGEEAGLVGSLCRMFEGRAPPEAVAAQSAAAEGNSTASAGLPEDLIWSRRTAALRALPLLFKLLGGDGITWKGVHRPIMDKIFSKAFVSSQEEVIAAAFKCWHVLIDALADIKYIQRRKSAQITMINPIAVMLRKSSSSVKKMALCEWEHLLLVSFPDAAEQTWHASDQDRDLAAAFLGQFFTTVSGWHANDQDSCMAARLDVIEQMMESLRKLRRPDIILLVSEELAGASFLGRLALTLTNHPELTIPCLRSCIPSLIAPWFTHAICVLKASLPALQEGVQWPKVLIQFYTSTINLPGMFTNADCQRTNTGAVLHMFGDLATILAQHRFAGECMADVPEIMDMLMARLTPAMLSSALPRLHVDSLQNSAGSSSEVDKEQTLSTLSHLLHWWILMTLVAPSAHAAKCVEKMQVLLTAVDQSPMPVLHLQTLLKSLKQHLNETTKVRYSKAATAQEQEIKDVGTFGTTATMLCTLAAHSLGYNLANTEEFDNSSEAAASALQDACTALMLPFKFWDGLASRAAAASGMQFGAPSATKQKHSSCADNESGSQQPAKALQEPYCPSSGESPDAEAATCSSVPDGHASAACDSSAERSAEDHQAERLPSSTAAQFEQAWKSLLESVLSVSSRKRSFKKEICGEVARRICGIAERLPVNGMALVCLQLASSASNTLAHQVQKSQPGKLIVEAAQLRRERLDVLKLLGVLLRQLVRHVEQGIPIAAACTAQVLKALAGLLKHTWEDFKVLDILKLLFDPVGALLKHTGHSSIAPIGEPLQSCWAEVLKVLVAQERPGHSLASALSQRPSCVTEMLQPLCYGFTHSCARIRASSLELWNDPKLQCVLGKHLAGLPQNVQQALARGAELGFASQPSQPAVKPPHKPPPIAPRSALPLPPSAPLAAEQHPQQEQKQQPQQQQGLATAGGTALVGKPGKRPAARLFQDTQTEYVRIDTATKRPRKDLLTDHQKEVAARHRQGTGREGIITHTRLDVSQDVLSLLKASGSVPDSERLDSPVIIDNKGPAAAHDGAVGEPVMHAEPCAGQQASQDAAMYSRAAEEAQLPSSAAREQDVLDPKCNKAADAEAIHNQQDCSSAQKAEVVTHNGTVSGGDQQGGTLQEACPGASSAQAAAAGVEVCQPQGQSAPCDGPTADKISAEGAHVSSAPQAPTGKENSNSQQQHPQQEQQWRKKRSLAQMARQSVSPPRGPALQSAPGAIRASQQVPDVVDLSEDAPLSTGAANVTLETPALEGQAKAEWQPASGKPKGQCAENTENRPASAMTEAVHASGAPAKPVDAQMADLGSHHEDHMQPTTVPESYNIDEEDVDIDVGQIHGHAEEHVWGEQGVVMTAAAMCSVPQTLLQTCVLGSVPNTACAAIPATAIEPLLLSAGPSAHMQTGSVLPEANEVGGQHQQGQPLSERAPVSETDVQELQLTGLTQQLGQVARPGKLTAGTTLDRLQSAITAAIEEALEVGTRTGSLQQLDALQQMLIKATAQIGEERIQRRSL